VEPLNEADRVHFLQKVICSGLSVVTKIQDKPGVQDLHIPEADFDPEQERQYCDNCNTPLVSFHRSCEVCNYDLCLTCCREIREGSQPGGDSAKRSVVAEAENDVEFQTMTSPLDSAPLPVFEVNSDLLIPCPRCCCEKQLLELNVPS
jgi:hypothetical protein